jgi:hypothetical protein
MKIGIAITSFGSVDKDIYHNHLSVLLHWNKQYDIVCYHVGDVQQYEAINNMVDMAITDKCTHVLFLEHDNLYPKDMLKALIEDDKDVISGYYPFRNWPYLPIPMIKNEDNGLLYRLDFVNGDSEKPNVMEMTVACFGCCLIKTPVLEDLFSKGLKFRSEFDKKTASTLTTDVVLFRDLLDNDYKIHVDGHVRVGHLTQRMVVDPDNYQLFREMFKLVYPQAVDEEEQLSEEEWTKRCNFLLGVKDA